MDTSREQPSLTVPSTVGLATLLQQCYSGHDEATSQLSSIYDLGTASVTSCTSDIHLKLKHALQTLETYSQWMRQPISDSEKVRASDDLASCLDVLHEINQRLSQFKSASTQSLTAATTPIAASMPTADTTPAAKPATGGVQRSMLKIADPTIQPPYVIKRVRKTRNKWMRQSKKEAPGAAEMESQTTKSRNGHTSGLLAPGSDLVAANTTYRWDTSLEEGSPFRRGSTAVSPSGDLQSTSIPNSNGWRPVAATDEHCMAEGRLPTDQEPVGDASGALRTPSKSRRARAIDFF